MSSILKGVEWRKDREKKGLGLKLWGLFRIFSPLLTCWRFVVLEIVADIVGLQLKDCLCEKVV